MKTLTIEELSGRTGDLAYRIIARLLRIGNPDFGGTIKPTTTDLANIEPNPGRKHGECVAAPLTAATHAVTYDDPAGFRETTASSLALGSTDDIREPSAPTLAATALAPPVEEIKPAERGSTSLVPAASDDRSRPLKRDIAQKYFDAKRRRMGFAMTSEPGSYTNCFNRETISVPDVGATLRSKLAYLRFRLADWVLEVGEEPEREYPYLSRNTAQARYHRRKEYWSFHWLQYFGNGAFFRRSIRIVGFKECPSHADALKLIACLDNAEPGWMYSKAFKPSVAKFRKMGWLKPAVNPAECRDS